MWRFSCTNKSKVQDGEAVDDVSEIFSLNQLKPDRDEGQGDQEGDQEGVGAASTATNSTTAKSRYSTAALMPTVTFWFLVNDYRSENLSHILFTERGGERIQQEKILTQNDSAISEQKYMEKHL